MNPVTAASNLYLLWADRPGDAMQGEFIKTDTDSLIAELGLHYRKLISQGLPKSVHHLLCRPECGEIRRIGAQLIELHGSQILQDIGQMMHPTEDELAFTANLILPIIWEIPFDFQHKRWVYPASPHTQKPVPPEIKD